jgi:ABC-type nickel/cobalt efflux system permease component RcnA
MAAYLVGTRGRPLDAVLLGVIVSAMHTASVLILGVALFQIDQAIALDDLFPWLTLISGVCVLVIGIGLAVSRGRLLRIDRPAGELRVSRLPMASHPPARAPSRGGSATALLTTTPDLGPLHELDDDQHHHHGHDNGHDHRHENGRDHVPDHGHEDHGHRREHAHDDHGPDHDHGHDLPEGVAPLSKRGLVLLATAGGIVPSPSAAIVLISAFTLGRVGLGLALVLAFSIGLAVTLTAVGLAMVLGGRVVNARLSADLIRLMPIAGAAVLVVLGLGLPFQGLRAL